MTGKWLKRPRLLRGGNGIGLLETLDITEYCDGLGPEPGGCYNILEIQKLTARVFHDGGPVTKIEDLKTNR